MARSRAPQGILREGVLIEQRHEVEAAIGLLGGVSVSDVQATHVIAGALQDVHDVRQQDRGDALIARGWHRVDPDDGGDVLMVCIVASPDWTVIPIRRQIAAPTPLLLVNALAGAALDDRAHRKLIVEEGGAAASLVDHHGVECLDGRGTYARLRRHPEWAPV